MNKELENTMADFKQDINEIISSLTILKNAIKNEYAPTNINDIDNMLEILLYKFNDSMKKYNTIQEKLFINQN